jgi:beta-phosphoglucomutase
MITQKFKAVLFDMDGTLVNNLQFHLEAWMSFLKKYSRKITPQEFNEKNHGTIYEIIPRFFPEYTDAETIRKLGFEKEKYYRDLYEPHIKPVEGLIPFLEKLTKENTRIGLATAGDLHNINFTLDNLSIRSYFSAITGSEEVRYGKPNPEVYLLTAHKLNTKPEDCLVIEDSIAGIKAGIAAGMQVMALTTAHSYAELEAYPLFKIIDNYSDL